MAEKKLKIIMIQPIRLKTEENSSSRLNANVRSFDRKNSPW